MKFTAKPTVKACGLYRRVAVWSLFLLLLSLSWSPGLVNCTAPDVQETASSEATAADCCSHRSNHHKGKQRL